MLGNQISSLKVQISSCQDIKDIKMLRKLVNAKKYASVSEVIRVAVKRLLKSEDIQTAIQDFDRKHGDEADE